MTAAQFGAIKKTAKRVLQRVLGLHAYLVLHAFFVALTLRFRKNEGGIVQFIARLRADAYVLDIGANVGTMTVLFAVKCKRCMVYAFEPVPDNVNAIRSVLGILRIHNANVFVYGLGESEAMVDMMTPYSQWVNLAGLSYVVDREHPPRAEGVVHRVASHSLDDIPEVQRIKVDAMKIDVEDHEQFVLRGALRTIMRDRPLVYCELWGGENKRVCFELLEQCSYAAYVATNAGLSPYAEGKPDGINFLFVPQEHALH